MKPEQLTIITPNGMRLLRLDASPTQDDLRDIVHDLAPEPTQREALGSASEEFPKETVEAFYDACQAWLIGQSA